MHTPASECAPAMVPTYIAQLGEVEEKVGVILPVVRLLSSKDEPHQLLLVQLHLCILALKFNTAF